MSVLKERGLDVALREAFQKGAPLLGTCVGAQIALSRSEEGDAECLNLIPGDCARFRLADQSLKIPHMGWNTVELARDHPVLKDIEARTEFYFVHSYYMRPADRRCVYAWCDYEITFPAILGYRNLIATQFHSEKSGPAGLTLLRNFARWDGTEC
jgi:glutamine amidotransferase